MENPIEKEILLARLKYLSDIKSKEDEEVTFMIMEVMKSMINKGDIRSNMAVESVYNYLLDMEDIKEQNLEQKALEIVSFID